MKKQITFKLEDINSLDRLTDNYFVKMGFKKVKGPHNSLTYIKGSRLMNMVTFNPLNWRTVVTVTVNDNVVNADFDINTLGQMVTPKEEGLWDTFVNNYKMSLDNNVDVTSENLRQLKETKSDSWNYVKWAILGAIAFGVLFGFLAYLIDWDMLAPMGAAIGAVVFVVVKKNRESKKGEL